MISKIKLIAIAIVLMTIQGTGQEKSTSLIKSANRLPRIFPDYTNILIPPNIAPLNFKVLEPLDEASIKKSEWKI